MNVARNEKIDFAIAIVIGPGSARAESATSHAGLFCYVFEFAIAQVVIERIATVAGDVNILQSVVVVVRNGDSHAPTLARKTCSFGDVGEFDVTGSRIGILTIKRDQRISAAAKTLDRRPIDRDNIEFAVIVAIDQAYTPAHRLDNIFLIWRRDVGNGEACLLSNILEPRGRQDCVSLIAPRPGGIFRALGLRLAHKEKQRNRKSYPRKAQISHSKQRIIQAGLACG